MGPKENKQTKKSPITLFNSVVYHDTISKVFKKDRVLVAN